MESAALYDYSVAIPAYGRPKDVQATVEAALSQQFPPDMTWEVVVNDDGTPRPLRETLSEYDGRIRLERNSRNLGFAGNWNETLRVARGKWVHMLHSDDLVTPQFAPIMWDVIRQAPPNTAFIHSDLSTMVAHRPMLGRLYARLRRRREPADQPGAPYRVYGRGIEAVRHVLGQGVRNTTVVVRREMAGAIGGYLERYGNFSDEEYYVRLAQMGDVVFVPRHLVAYRYHGDQISFRDWLRSDFIDDYGNMYDAIVDALDGQLNDQDRALVNRRVGSAGVGVARVQALHGDLGSARATLRKALERSPRILQTKDYRLAALLVESMLARGIYRSFFS